MLRTRCGRRLLLLLLLLALLPQLPGAAAGAADDFVNFESSHVHPIALSESGEHLYAVNTPEARLAVFEVATDGSLALVAEIPVGLEPVSVALRPGSDEVWVANHVSDSVSVVDVGSRRVIATMHVGDEPTDVAFANGRAFVSLAGAEDRVAIYDAASREAIASIAIHSDDPRALAVTPDGSQVAVVALNSGNQTTLVRELLVAAAGGPPPPDPPRRVGNYPLILRQLKPNGPDTGLIVKYDPLTGGWEDETGGDWSGVIQYSLADRDLYLIDALADPPEVARVVSHVGTSLFEVAIHPGTGAAWVPNTDARNLVRFEPKLRGHLVETRVTIVPMGGEPVFVDLNPHIDYGVSPGPPEELGLSLAQPGDGVFSADGSRFYLAAFGSSLVAVLDGSSGVVLERIAVPGGPSGLALNERTRRLYVMSRFSNSIAIVDTETGTQVGVMGLAGPTGFDPSPVEIREGRRFLYEASLSSGHGDLSCATCHLFGDFDGLAWDLGDPTGDFTFYSSIDPPLVFAPNPSGRLGFDPMKGPMSTQTLRGLRGLEPFHWRGDRADFQAFNPAFDSLLGRAEPLSDDDMDAFAAFIMTIELPPNPFRNPDDSLPETVTGIGDPGRGELVFRDEISTGGRFTCNECHRLPLGTTTNLTLATLGSQDIKIPHLRNVYEKIGFDPFRVGFENSGNRDLRSGFGATHDGKRSLREFISGFGLTDEQKDDVAEFVLAFPTGTFPCVGHQQAVGAWDEDDLPARAAVDTLMVQAGLGRCDLIARGTIGSRHVGYVYDPEGGVLHPSTRRDSPSPMEPFLASLRRGDLVTFTGVPPGSGRRLGVDRDRDGCLDGDERVPDDGRCHELVAVEIDIQPGVARNTILPFGRGVTPVVIFGSGSFDVGDVDRATLAFGPGRASPRHRKAGHVADVNGDGLLDLVSHYPTLKTGIALGDEEACVSGETSGGDPFEGCDRIATAPGCGRGFELALLLPPLAWLRRKRQGSEEIQAASKNWVV